MRLNLSLILLLSSIACYAQDTTKPTVYYQITQQDADSIAYDLEKCDQLEVLYKATVSELDFANGVVSSQVDEITALNEARTEDTEYYEAAIEKHKKEKKGIVVIAILLIAIIL
jgi:hypothetical protein